MATATGRLLLGHGHCLTIDSAQGITSGEHINALPRGSAGVTAFKAYVAESRHVSQVWTMVGEAAEREAERAARPLGDPRPVTSEDLWARVGRNLSNKPYKPLGMDLLNTVRLNQRQAAGQFIDNQERLQRHATPDLWAALAGQRRAEVARRCVAGMLSPLAQEVRAQQHAVAGIRGAVAQQVEAMQAVIARAAQRFGDLLAMYVRPQPEPPAPRRRPTPGMGL
jgi:hypothetical protein